MLTDAEPVYAAKLPAGLLDFDFHPRFRAAAEALLGKLVSGHLDECKYLSNLHHNPIARDASDILRVFTDETGEVFNKLPGAGDVPPHQDNVPPRCNPHRTSIPRDASERSLVFLSLTAGEQFTSQEYKDNVDGNGYAIAKVVSLLLFGHFLRAIVLFEVSPSELWAHCSCIIH